MRYISPRKALAVGGGALIIASSAFIVAAPVMALSTLNGDSAQSAASAQTRLSAAKLRICTTRKNTIDNILKRISDRGNRHITLISNVATKTEAFYVKSGKSIDNYDSLVATVNAGKTTAQAAVEQVKSDSTSFSCDSTDPVGTLQSYKTDVATQVTALQNYKASVKALVDGVKSVVETTGTGGSQ